MEGTMKKRIAAAALALLIAVGICGCSGKVKEKTFEDSGLTITLTDAFSKAQYDPYTVCYASQGSSVFALKEDFEAVGDDSLTLEEYANAAIKANSLDCAVTTENGVTYFVFEANLTEGNYTYLAAVYKGADAYWLVQFACNTEQYEGMKPELLKYAQSVKV